MVIRSLLDVKIIVEIVIAEMVSVVEKVYHNLSALEDVECTD
jgi:hypothetical protein